MNLNRVFKQLNNFFDRVYIFIVRILIVIHNLILVYLLYILNCSALLGQVKQTKFKICIYYIR